MAKKDVKKSEELAPESAPVAEVSVAKEPLVQLHYSGDNHHILDHVHAIRQGINHVPAAVWAKVKEAPAIVKLIADGKLKEKAAE